MRLFRGDFQPVEIKRGGHDGETPDGVERQIDRVEFDVRERVQQHGPPRVGLHAAALQRTRFDEFGGRSGRPGRSGGSLKCERRFDRLLSRRAPRRKADGRASAFVCRIALAKDGRAPLLTRTSVENDQRNRWTCGQTDSSETADATDRPGRLNAIGPRGRGPAAFDRANGYKWPARACASAQSPTKRSTAARHCSAGRRHAHAGRSQPAAPPSDRSRRHSGHLQARRSSPDHP